MSLENNSSKADHEKEVDEISNAKLSAKMEENLKKQKEEFYRNPEKFQELLNLDQERLERLNGDL